MERVVLFLFIFFSLNVIASPWSREENSLSSKNQNIKKTILSKNAELVQLQKQMKLLDQDLGIKEKQLSTFDESALKQQQAIEAVKESFIPLKKEITELEKDMNRLLKRLYLNNLESEPTISQLAEKKQLHSFIETLAIELKLRKQEFAKIELQMKEEEQKLVDLVSTKQTLLSLIEETKQKKIALAEDLKIKSTQKVPPPTVAPSVISKPVATPRVAKNKTEDYLFDISASKDQKNSSKKFALPLKDFISMNVEGKGVALVYQEKTAIYAPDNAKVVFTGELASYGKVIMLDHGDDIRTVLLGNLTAKISKYDEVKQGDLLGYTDYEIGKKNQLYFEVRKKDFVLNTSQFLNKNLLKSRN